MSDDSIIYNGYGFVFKDILDEPAHILTDTEHELLQDFVESSEMTDLVMNNDYEKSAEDPVTTDGYVGDYDFFTYIPDVQCVVPDFSKNKPRIYQKSEADSWLNYHTHVLFNAIHKEMQKNHNEILDKYKRQDMPRLIDNLIKHMDVTAYAMHQHFSDTFQ